MSELIFIFPGLFGAIGSGKTSIMKNFLENKFNPKELSTVGLDFGMGSIYITVDKEYITTFQIWDFSGNKKFSDK